VIPVVRADEPPFYTMRLVKDGNVEQRVTPGQGFAFDQAIALLRDVAAALDYAHANGVVHRDIKPANILIGDSGHAMVADFGIARAFGGDPSATTATGTGVVGSPAYMSPEQWRGEKVDGKADQYALGILAFELLTGRRPFADASMQELLRMHLAENPPDIISFRGDLPPHLTDTIRRAMSKEPADRYPTAMAFVNALAGEAGTRPQPGVPARAPAVGVSSAKTTVKQPTPMPAAKTVPVGRRAPVAPAAAGVASNAHASTRGLWIIAALLVVVGGLGGALWVARGRLLRDATPTAAPPVAVVPAATGVSADSFAAVERAQSAENAKLQQEVADARRIALDAEKKMEVMRAAQKPPAKAKAAPAETHAHLFVMAQGGKPAVFVDGEKMANESPAVIEVKPGRHIVTMEGSGTEFRPAEYSVDVTAADTTNLTFISRQTATRQQQLRQQADLAALTPEQKRDLAVLTPEQKRRYLQQLRKRFDGARGQKPPIP
jgi:hypothetical protein